MDQDSDRRWKWRGDKDEQSGGAMIGDGGVLGLAVARQTRLFASEDWGGIVRERERE